MSDISVQDLSLSSNPFFTRYLEDQLQELTEIEVESTRGGSMTIPTLDPPPPFSFRGCTVAGDELEILISFV